MRAYLAVALVNLSAMTAGCVVSPAQSKTAPKPCLRMELQPQPEGVSAPGKLFLLYDVRNWCSRAIAFCKPTGVGIGCYSPLTGGEGVEPGTHDYPCPLDRVVKLRSHEALKGLVMFPLDGISADRVEVQCVYQTDGSGSIGDMPLWVGRITSNWLKVRLP
jgi:hypothetical protein